jgi:hypothetical protein
VNPGKHSAVHVALIAVVPVAFWQSDEFHRALDGRTPVKSLLLHVGGGAAGANGKYDDVHCQQEDVAY